jgi:hypothetical protein
LEKAVFPQQLSYRTGGFEARTAVFGVGRSETIEWAFHDGTFVDIFPMFRDGSMEADGVWAGPGKVASFGDDY